jgi:hypothetical protein
MLRKGIVIGIIILFVGSFITSNSLSKDIRLDGKEEREIFILNSPPIPPLDTRNTIIEEESLDLNSVIISDVPTSKWTYGCAATTAGMLFGYYDRIGWGNMYTGPTNGGVCPLKNLGQGCPEYYNDYPIPGSCYIIATENGLDGITTRGHVDDYWISENSPGPDPWDGNWEEHEWDLCLADYMGVSQWKWDYNLDDIVDSNMDGSSVTYFLKYGKRGYNHIPSSSYGLPTVSNEYGMKLFAESRGYKVEEYYTQVTNTPFGHSSGFTFDEFKDEIDNGVPVFTFWVNSDGLGHAMLGVGYNPNSKSIFIHDTWDNNLHEVLWDGSYVGYNLLGVIVIHFRERLDQVQMEEEGWRRSFDGEDWIAQEFTPSLEILTRVQLGMLKQGHPPDDINITIGIKHYLGGEELTNCSVKGGEIVWDQSGPYWLEFDFPDIIVRPGTKYYIVCRIDDYDRDSDNKYSWYFHGDNPYDGGKAYVSWNSGNFWYSFDVFDNDFPFRDFCFRTFGTESEPPNKPVCEYIKADNLISMNSTDSDGDKIRFGISWENDGYIDEYTEYIESGTEIFIDCEGKIGTIGVLAEDEYGVQSDWVFVKPKNKLYFNRPFLNLLAMYPNLFPMLRQLLLKL